MLIDPSGRNASPGKVMLPAVSTYVDSLGPLYHELELEISSQPQTEHTCHTREKPKERWLDSHQLLTEESPCREYFGFTELPLKPNSLE